MRYIVSILSILVILNASAQVREKQNQLLWEVSGNGLKEKSYIYGSLHSNDKRLFQFADSVYVAMHRAKGIVLETDLFSLFHKLDTRVGESSMLYDAKGNPYTGSNRASKTVYGSEDGMPQFLDAYFQQYCYNSDKSFYALESVEEQMGMLNGIVRSDMNHLGLLSAEIVQDRMIDLYLQGDIDGIDRIMKVNLAAYEGAYQKLIIDRNKVMFQGMDSLMKKGSVFCAIGAGHLSGDQGVITLLRKKGYKVRAVNAHYSEQGIPEKTIVKSQRAFEYENESMHLAAIFPGKPYVIEDGGDTKLIYRELGQGNTYVIQIYPRDDERSLVEQAQIYIASPDASPFRCKILDDDTEICEGISDAYPEGLHWVRIMQNEEVLVIMKAYGGNKFMNSNRPRDFFNKVWFDH
jgi:uncharacterized protein YbaP (TraB family)